MSSANPLRIIVVEDQVATQIRLARMLAADPCLVLTATLGSVEEALRRVAELSPDVALMDIRFPGRSGIDGVRELKRLRAGILVLMITQFDDSDLLFEALVAGADGYLLKSEPDEQLREAILEAQAGGAPMSRPIARKVLQHFRASPGGNRTVPTLPGRRADTDALHTLTGREHEILAELATGASCKQIGGRLKIQEATVRVHLSAVYRKLRVSSATGAVAKYLGQPPG